MSRTRVELNGKSVEVHLSGAAERALVQRPRPLLAEMELYFSCLIRYKVRFHEQAGSTGVTVNDKLQLRFRPVMTARCGNDYEGDEPPLTDFPIEKPAAFTPHWLHIDYRHGQWQGEFGY
ncbi:hypothetical protein [Thiohalophilus thiocyanatoxydans]|uniref:Uncharacterized protein n=1 Tax=Thiohalophilus thiocyanatoxydans TaxID=381308 RepID=A0A4R8ISH6_9GAMM|nr:hypothetical protein [Thiohalophilus thiocyanatoxydans]TDY00499.1 hypothetical protein EDC23_2000 [Thiohalophilus thiocyanatoxydans]